jgi:hypothetical protein
VGRNSSKQAVKGCNTRWEVKTRSCVDIAGLVVMVMLVVVVVVIRIQKCEKEGIASAPGLPPTVSCGWCALDLSCGGLVPMAVDIVGVTAAAVVVSPLSQLSRTLG